MKYLRISESLDVNHGRAPRKYDTLYSCLENCFVQDNQNLMAVFTAEIVNQPREIADRLYIEPRDKVDPPQDLLQAIREDHDEPMPFKDFTNMEELDAHLANNDPICVFLFGSIGCGKTTFVSRFADRFDNNGRRLCFYLDMGVWRGKLNSDKEYEQLKSNCVSDLDHRLFKFLNEQNLYQKYLEHVVFQVKDKSFHPYLSKVIRKEAFDWSDRKFLKVVDDWSSRHAVTALLEAVRVLRENGYQIILILDNIDPLPLVYQERIALRTLELVQQSGVQAIIPLRYFSAREMQRAASGYRPAIMMSLGLPSISELIEKRMEVFVYERMKQDRYPVKIGEDITLFIPKSQLVAFLKYIQREILSGDLVDLFLHISDGNIRAMLKNYGNVLRSKYLEISPDTIVNFYEPDARAAPCGQLLGQRSFDVLLKASITTGTRTYNYDKSMIENVYHVYSAPKHQAFLILLKLQLLNFLWHKTSLSFSDVTRRRFVDKASILEAFDEMSWSVAVVDVALEEMFNKLLLTGYESIHYGSNIRLALSNCGVIFRNRIHRMVYYIYFMALDSPLAIDRIDKFFEKVSPKSGSSHTYRIRRKYNHIMDHDLCHFMALEFVAQFSEIERRFARIRLSTDDQKESFASYVRGPMAPDLINSVIRHIGYSKKQLFEKCISTAMQEKSKSEEVFSWLTSPDNPEAVV